MLAIAVIAASMASLTYLLRPYKGTIGYELHDIAIRPGSHFWCNLFYSLKYDYISPNCLIYFPAGQSKVASG